ncbi:MAG: Uma2 family endonuclease [Arcicella sp.]|jgi:Uma2 family endonuclease|nr:Uma2 family endonuclease [Arcicella sp.]
MIQASILNKRNRLLSDKKRVAVDTYFKMEEKATDKHEFHNGIVLKMAGAKFQHNLLAQKIASIIDNYIDDNDLNFMVSNSDTKIRIDAFNKIVYPDAVVICEKPSFYLGRKDTIVNPLLVVEVLSESTETHDKNTKFEYYRALDSFKEYVLISQERKQLTVYTKQEDNSWILRDYENDDSIAILHTLQQCPVSLKRLYKGIDI